jgi:hypothetical protein
MKVENSVLFVIVFGAKINKCEHYLKIKMLIFRFYNMNYGYGSPLLLKLDMQKFSVILVIEFQ